MFKNERGGLKDLLYLVYLTVIKWKSNWNSFFLQIYNESIISPKAHIVTIGEFFPNLD